MNNALIFSFGAVFGSIVTLFAVRKYVNTKIEEEKERIQKEADDVMIERVEKNKQKLQADYEEALKQYRNEDKPYRITEEEFDSIDFDTESLTLYKNNVLVYDANDEKVDDIDELIGRNNIPDMTKESIEAFYIRNPQKKMDYEINIMLCEWTGEDELIE
jgi:hypothetical protein